MKLNAQLSLWCSCLGVGILTLAMAFTASFTSAQEATNEAVTAQSAFDSPADAGQALLSAALTADSSALARVLGPDAVAFLSSGDLLEDKAAMASFARKYEQMNRWVAMTDGNQILHIGADNYEFPVPLAKSSPTKWRFDAIAGHEEVTARNIGRNELLAIDAVYALASAEEIYFQTPRNGNPAPQYTRIIISSPGKQDGLYWEVPKGVPASPLGRVNEFLKNLSPVAPGEAQVFDGYSFRILTKQGDQAKGGRRNYLANGKLTGFAIMASPVKYRETGIMTFVLNREGIMYQKDLGARTAELASSIESYNPDNGWDYVE